jgi:hypothetical protein
MNLDYCSCNELDMAGDHNAIRYYRPEDDRFYSVKRADGISVPWTTNIQLIV